MPITSTGIGSGLDVESLVSQLVLAEVQPKETRLNRSEAAFQAEISSYGLIKGALSSFQSVSKTVSDPATYQAKSASVSDYTKMSASATNGVASGSYAITVSALAEKQSLATAESYPTTSTTVGTGKLTISLGTTTYDGNTDAYTGFTPKTGTTAVEISIDSSSSTLTGVRDAINGADAGVSASIVYDGSNYRLTLTAKDSGAENSIAITVDDDDLGDSDASGLSNLSFSSTATSMIQTVAASDAALTINGLAVTSSSNIVTKAVDNLDITLKETFSTVETIIVSDNTSTIKTAVQGFVDGYNDLVKVLNQQTSYNPETGQGSTLTGDSTVRTLLGKIRNYMNDQVNNNLSSYGYAAQVGLKTKTLDGTIEIDATKFDAALKSDPLDIATVFGAYGRSSNTNVQFVSSTSASKAGEYAVSLTPAVAGSILGTSLANNLNFSTGNNDATFDITVDGETASVTINSNFASDAEAAAGVQAAINSALSTKSVSVILSGASNDQLLIQSNTSGSASSVTVSNLDNNANSGLGLGTVTTTSGADATGLIGGFAATISGAQMAGAIGTPVEGIKLEILGGASSGLGSVYFSRGVGSKIDDLLARFLASDGIVEARLTGLAASVKDIADSRLSLGERASNLESIYRNQFNGLETLISNINKTSSFLTTALAGFVKPLSFKK